MTTRPVPTQGWFAAVNRFAQHTPALHTVMTAYAKYGVVLFALLLGITWLVARRSGNPRLVAASLWAPVGVLVALAVNQPIVRLVHEPRPFTVFPAAEVLVHRSQDFSFPSDHAVMAGAVAAGVLLVDRRLGIVAAVLAVLMAFARVYVGAHFPVDVLAGLAVGVFVVVLGYLLLRVPATRAVEGLERTRLRPFVTVRRAES
ncbi:MAG: phosphatase PAP2 family protein [Nocardioidaceae bacterium]